jgi:hypothetical protein
MCCIDYESARERIAAVIVGPPNRREITRKEFTIHRVQNRELAKLKDENTPIDRPNPATCAPDAIAAIIVSEILKTGIQLVEQRSKLITSAQPAPEEPHLAEFWISLASLLRSYTALHGVDGNRQAEIEAAGGTITVRHAEKALILKRHRAIVTWTRENGCNGAMAFTEHGTLRSDTTEEAMDMVAEQWARELMQREPLVQLGN